MRAASTVVMVAASSGLPATKDLVGSPPSSPAEGWGLCAHGLLPDL